MARSGEVNAAMATIAGVPRGVVEQLDRRLGAMKLLPRQRGRYGPNYEPIHLATLMTGLMIWTDGISRTGASVLHDLPALQRMRESREVSYIHTHHHRSVRSISSQSFVGSFVEAVAKELEKLARGDDPNRDRVIGMTFAGEAICGWIDQVTVGGDEGERGRHEFGDWQAVDLVGFKREARFELPALLRIADLWKPEDGAA
jgi:hypothetical protein